MRYRQAKLNAENSAEALERFLRLLAVAALGAPDKAMTIAAHSLGAYYLERTLHIGTTTAALSAARNIVLLAPCCKAAGHTGWLERIHPQGQLFVTFHAADTVLTGAGLTDGATKLGLHPGSILQRLDVRYVDFAGVPMSLGGHSYFVTERGRMPTRPGRLLQRIFRGERDIAEEPGPPPRRIYLGCNADRSVCYLGPPARQDPPLTAAVDRALG